jgi:hypothetical protein
MKLTALIRMMGEYSSKEWDLLGVYSTRELAEQAEAANRADLERQSNEPYGTWLKHEIKYGLAYDYVSVELDATTH